MQVPLREPATKHHHRVFKLRIDLLITLLALRFVNTAELFTTRSLTARKVEMFNQCAVVLAQTCECGSQDLVYRFVRLDSQHENYLEQRKSL